jgi:hypothetical protein
LKRIVSWRTAAPCAALILVSVWSSAWAQARAIPIEARRAKIAPYNTSFLRVENQLVRLLPGVRIYNDQNRTITPGKVPQDAIARIRYNDSGEIRELWILTSEEIARKDPNPESARRPGRSPIVTPIPAPVPAPAPEIIVTPATSSP